MHDMGRNGPPLGIERGGGPLTKGLVDGACAAPAPKEFTFVQISDSHIGFNKPANPDAVGTLREAIAKIKALPVKPAFMIHTGDISHLSKDEEFDNADQLIKEAGLPVFYVPGEHDLNPEELNDFRRVLEESLA